MSTYEPGQKVRYGHAVGGRAYETYTVVEAPQRDEGAPPLPNDEGPIIWVTKDDPGSSPVWTLAAHVRPDAEEPQDFWGQRVIVHDVIRGTACPPPRTCSPSLLGNLWVHRDGEPADRLTAWSLEHVKMEPEEPQDPEPVRPYEPEDGKTYFAMSQQEMIDLAGTEARMMVSSLLGQMHKRFRSTPPIVLSIPALDVGIEQGERELRQTVNAEMAEELRLTRQDQAYLVGALARLVSATEGAMIRHSAQNTFHAARRHAEKVLESNPGETVPAPETTAALDALEEVLAIVGDYGLTLETLMDKGHLEPLQRAEALLADAGRASILSVEMTPPNEVVADMAAAVKPKAPPLVKCAWSGCPGGTADTGRPDGWVYRGAEGFHPTCAQMMD